MSSLLQDIRYALRSLRRTPGFTLAAVLTLALGIGATSAVYSVGNGILWRPLPVPDPHRLAVLYIHRDDGSGYDDLSWPDYRDLRGESRAVFEDLIAYTPRPVSLGLPGNAERAWAELVSANYFEILGRPPSVGRGFLPAEDSAGAAPVVILSDALWRARFRADPTVLGQVLRINGREFTIVGVASPGFQTPFYVGFQPSLWLAAGSAWAYLTPDPGGIEVRGDVTFRMLGRLQPGVDLSSARAAVEGMVRRLGVSYPDTYRGITGALFAESDARPEPGLAEPMRLGLRLFLVIGLVVLLVACANVASLLLARALARRREIAVRLALGASRARLVTQLLGESLVLAAAGGGLGLLIAAGLSGAVENLLHFSTDIPFVLDFSLDRRVTLFTTVITLLTTFAFGLIPALQASSPATAGALKSDAAGWRGLHKTRLRAGLVVAQLALSSLLLVGAGLVVRSFTAMQRVSPGFETKHGLLVSISPGLVGYDAVRGRQVYREVFARLRAVPGVTGVTLAQSVPLEFTSSSELIVPEGGATGTPDKPGETVGWTTIGPEYFTTMGTPLIDGRDFGPGDTVGAPAVAVVSREMAERYWPGQPAVGKVFHVKTFDGTALTVIGVAADAKYRQLSESPEPHVYIPLGQDYPADASLVIRAAGNPLTLVPQVRRELAAVDPDLPVSDVKTFDELLAGRALLMPRIATRVTATLGVLALLLALVGLYGIVAYSVAQRTRELGIRLALGATEQGVVRLLLLEGLKLAGTGIVIGVAAALMLTRVARSLLFGVSTTDPLVLGLVLASLAGVTLVASWIPARRAARTDPMLALRSE
jgi:putative ABC transport system permease protein